MVCVNKQLTLGQIKSLSIDQIIGLYRQGFSLQGANDAWIPPIPINEQLSPHIESLTPCTIQAVFFDINGSPATGSSCSAKQSDKITTEVDASFSTTEQGKQYRATIQLRGPGGVTINNVSSYINVTSGTQNFIFADWQPPIDPGPYSILAASIIDINGNTACPNAIPSGGNCQALSVTQLLSSIHLSPTTLSVEVGKTTEITATCIDTSNNQITCPTLTWSSSDTNIAAVDSSGVVTGKAIGQATISVHDPISDLHCPDCSLVTVTAPSGGGASFGPILIIGGLLAVAYIVGKKVVAKT